MWSRFVVEGSADRYAGNPRIFTSTSPATGLTIAGVCCGLVVGDFVVPGGARPGPRDPVPLRGEPGDAVGDGDEWYRLSVPAAAT